MESLGEITVESVLNYVLIMVGMSVIAGAGAKLMVPGYNLRGTLSTFMIGFFATLASGFLLKMLYARLWDSVEFNPIQPLTIVLSILLGAAGLFLVRCILGMSRE